VEKSPIIIVLCRAPSSSVRASLLIKGTFLERNEEGERERGERERRWHAQATFSLFLSLSLSLSLALSFSLFCAHAILSLALSRSLSLSHRLYVYMYIHIWKRSLQNPGIYITIKHSILITNKPDTSSFHRLLPFMRHTPHICMCDMSHVTHMTHYMCDISHATHMTHCVRVCVLGQVQGEKQPAQICNFYSKIELHTPTHMQRLQCTYVFQCALSAFERHDTTHMTSHDTVKFSYVNLSVWLSICLFFYGVTRMPR